MDVKKIGLFISLKRKEKNWTQQQLSKKLFISDMAVSRWERGLSIPDVSSLPNLSEILGITITVILFG